MNITVLSIKVNYSQKRRANNNMCIMSGLNPVNNLTILTLSISRGIYMIESTPTLRDIKYTISYQYSIINKVKIVKIVKLEV